MGMLVQEEVVAGSISGNPGGQLGHICGLCVYQLDSLPFQVQLLRRRRGGVRVSLYPLGSRTGRQAGVFRGPFSLGSPCQGWTSGCRGCSKETFQAWPQLCPFEGSAGDEAPTEIRLGWRGRPRSQQGIAMAPSSEVKPQESVCKGEPF